MDFLEQGLVLYEGMAAQLVAKEQVDKTMTKPWDTLRPLAKSPPMAAGYFRVGNGLRVQLISVERGGVDMYIGSVGSPLFHVSKKSAGELAGFFKDLEEQLAY